MILMLALVQRRHQPVEIRKRAEDRIDAGVVGDVIAEIGHGRGIERRDPDGVDAQPLQVVGTLGDPREIADAVAVAVLERARVDLVDDGRLPPRPLLRRHLRRPPAGAGSRSPASSVLPALPGSS